MADWIGKLVNTRYFRTSEDIACRISILNNNEMLVETITVSDYKVYRSKFLTLAGGRWPYSIVEDSLRNDRGESITNTEDYANMPDVFTPTETIVIRFDNNLKPIGWK
jgi:hypothetical protein